MIMPRGEPLLLPVNPVFIAASLAAGLAINMLPLGRIVWAPDVLMLLLVFWGVHQPSRIGMGVAFFLGLCMDVSQSALLGQHALSYTVLSFGAIAIHRRLLWFSVPSQALQVLPLFVLAHAVELLLRMVAGAFFQRQSNDIFQDYQIPNLGPLMSVNGNPGTLWLTKQHRVDKDYALFGAAQGEAWRFTLGATGRGGKPKAS